MLQAVEMGRASEIAVEVDVDDQGQVSGVELIGAAVRVMEGRIVV